MDCSAPALRFGTLAFAVGAACAFSLDIAGQVVASLRETFQGSRIGRATTTAKALPVNFWQSWQ